MFTKLSTFTAKLAILAAMLVLTAVGALYSTPSQAQTPSYSFISICGSVSTFYCPSGPNPIWFGPYSSWAQCDSAWASVSMSMFGTWPRVLSNCYQQ